MNRWTDAVLSPRRQQGDPVADPLVASLEGAHAVGAVNRLIAGLFRSDAPIPDGLPAAARSYFEDTAHLPEWADPARIAAGQRLFSRAGWSIGGALFCSSLPQAYAAARGAQVLTQTQGMTGHTRQRIFETAQFLFDVLDEGALTVRGRGVRAAQKVRLMHAAIRRLLLARAEPAWDSAVLGLPINQEDLCGTLMSFSITTLEAMQRLGERVAPADGEAWIHTWNVVGALMGIERELLPVGTVDARDLRDAILTRQWGGSAAGRALTTTLVKMMQGYLPPLAQGLPIGMIRHLAGHRCADLLGLPSTPWTRAIDAGIAVLGPAESAVGAQLQKRFFAPFSHRLMTALVNEQREGKQARFRIPASLRRTVDPRF